MQKSQFYYWIIIVAFSFGFYAKANSNIAFYSSKAFKIPPITKPKKSTPHLFPQEAKCFQWLYPTFLGKMKSTEVFHIQPDWYSLISTGFEDCSVDSLDNYDTGGLKLFIAPEISMKDPILGQENDAAFFPVFIVNETRKTKNIIRKKLHIETIHEAIDSNGVWRAIGQTNLSTVRKKEWQLSLHPKEFGIFLMPIYEGNYATQLRLRLKNGIDTVVSESYKGRISYEQFSLIKSR